MTIGTSAPATQVRSLGLVRVVAARSWLELRRDPTLAVLLLIVPGILMALLADTLGTAQQLVLPGGERDTFSVSGFAVCFSFYGSGFLALALHRQASLGTLARVAPSALGRRHVLAGEAVVVGLVVTGQVLLLVLLGGLAFGVRPSNPAGVLAAATLAGLWSVVLGLALSRIARRELHVQQLSNVVVLLGGVLGGAIAPVELLPAWASALRWVTPQYWILTLMRQSLGSPASGSSSVTITLGASAAGLVALAITARLVPWQRLHGVESQRDRRGEG